MEKFDLIKMKMEGKGSDLGGQFGQTLKKILLGFSLWYQSHTVPETCFLNSCFPAQNGMI